MPDDVRASEAAHLQEAWVGPDTEAICDAANDGRSGIGVERQLEALFGLKLLCGVVNDQNQAVRSARPIGQNETAHAVHPFGLGLAGTGDLNDQVVELFAREHPIDGVISLLQSTIISAAMGE